MRQRVMIGMSLLCEPTLVIADEPTTALDVTVQAQIIDLLRAMRAEVGMAMVLISHDLGVVAGLADRIRRHVRRADRGERRAADVLFERARHPYTAELLKCVPTFRARGSSECRLCPGSRRSREMLSSGLRVRTALPARRRALPDRSGRCFETSAARSDAAAAPSVAVSRIPAQP